MPRVISLLASSTEILCALGYESLLVGRSHECDYPVSIKTLPICTETKFPTDLKSLEIDRSIKNVLVQSLSVYRVLPSELEKLKPDLLVTQVQCEVCAVSFKDVEEALAQYTGHPPKIVSLNPNCLEDLFADIGRVAKGLGDIGVKGAMEAAKGLTSELRARIASIEMRGEGIPIEERPHVACIEWIEPMMAAGNWMPELVELAAGKNIFGTAGKHSTVMKWEELVTTDPDVIFISPCGFDIERTKQELSAFTSRREWNTLKAVRTGRVYLGDGNAFFNRPGPRLVESLEILAEIFHPESYDFGHEGTGWIKF